MQMLLIIPVAAQPRVNRTWLRQGGTRRDLPSLVTVEQQSEQKRQARYATVGQPRSLPSQHSFQPCPDPRPFLVQNTEVHRIAKPPIR